MTDSFGSFFKLTSGQTARAFFFFFNKAPKLFLLLQTDFNTHAKCIVISWIKVIFLSVSPCCFPLTDCLQIKVLMLHWLEKTAASCWEEFQPFSPSSCSGVCLGNERPTLVATSCCSASSACSCASASLTGQAVWWKGHLLEQVEVGGRRRALQGSSWKGCWEKGEGRQVSGWGWLQGLQGSCRWCCSQRWPARSPVRPPDYPGTDALPSTAAQSPARKGSWLMSLPPAWNKHK